MGKRAVKEMIEGYCREGKTKNSSIIQSVDSILEDVVANKDVFDQIMKNPKVELCFQGQGSQIIVSGVLEQVFDENLKNEIFNHLSRRFLQAWKENGVDRLLQIFRLKNGTAVEWTMATNFAEKKPVEL